MNKLIINIINNFISLKKDSKKMSVEVEESDNENIPQISLQEMLEDFHIREEPMDDS